MSNVRRNGTGGAGLNCTDNEFSGLRTFYASHMDSWQYNHMSVSKDFLRTRAGKGSKYGPLNGNTTGEIMVWSLIN